MGTRHLIIVYYKGQYHIAQYGQFDGYPSGQGVAILRFISNPDNVAKLKAVLENAANTIYTPTDAQLNAWQREMEEAYDVHQDRYDTLTTPEEREEWRSAGHHPEDKICPSISPYTGAGILDLVASAVPAKPVPIVKLMEFLADTLFCEFAYVVDLDADALEVYSSGCEMLPIEGESRFDQVECLKDAKDLPAMIGRFFFTDLPDEDAFVKSL